MFVILGEWQVLFCAFQLFHCFSFQEVNQDLVAIWIPGFKRVLWYLIASAKGGVNRAKILELVSSRPANANQIDGELSLDYTVPHHLRVLSEKGLIITDNEDSYRATYFLTPPMENNIVSFREILDRIGKK